MGLSAMRCSASVGLVFERNRPPIVPRGSLQSWFPQAPSETCPEPQKSTATTKAGRGAGRGGGDSPAQAEGHSSVAVQDAVVRQEVVAVLVPAQSVEYVLERRPLVAMLQPLPVRRRKRLPAGEK